MPIAETETKIWFLEYDLRDTADIMRERAENYDAEGDQDWVAVHEAAADRLDELADAVEQVTPALLTEYSVARDRERKLKGGGPDKIHCSMTMEIGFLLEPKTIEDVCRTYIRAVEYVRCDPRWRDPEADMYEFWVEFTRAGNA